MSKTRGKHKRGVRGSTEEGDSAPKRANTAASKDPEDITSGDEESETKDEPTRAELKSMLVDIQISISSILLDNRQTRKEMAQLTGTVLEQKAEIAGFTSVQEPVKLTDDVKQRKQKHFKQYRTAKQKLPNKENLVRFLHRGKPR